MKILISCLRVSNTFIFLLFFISCSAGNAQKAEAPNETRGKVDAIIRQAIFADNASVIEQAIEYINYILRKRRGEIYCQSLWY